MYAQGVIRPGSTFFGAGGVYLWHANATGGWGSQGEGAISGFEEYGQRLGRWFVPLPFGVVAVDEPASVASYNGRLYLTGGCSYNCVIDDHHRMWRQGLRPPEEAPDVTGAPGTTTLLYFSWYDELTGERSSLSKGTEVGTATPRTWQNLPTRPPDDVYVATDSIDMTASGTLAYAEWAEDSRLFLLRPGDRVWPTDAANQRYTMVWHPGYNSIVGSNPNAPLWMVERNAFQAVVDSPVAVAPITRATHLELWVSLAGDFPRLAMRVPIGTTSVTESKGIADLGEAFITPFQRFPRCNLNAIYHDRQIMAGDPENPDTVYLSTLFYPERFEGLLFRTRDGKAVTGILPTKDYCLVFTRSSTYLLQGYTDTDYSMTAIDQSLGSVGHNCNVVIHGNPYVWTEKGPFMFNGQWHPLSPENRWAAPAGSFESPRVEPGPAMVATEDPYFNCYIVSHAKPARREIGMPFGSIDEHAFVTPYDGDEEKLAPSQRSVNYDFHYAVLDYTLVQPEAGGALAPARLMFDKAADNRTSLITDNSFLEVQKYLRDRWGRGKLYVIGRYTSGGDDEMDRATTAPGNSKEGGYSFSILAMVAPETGTGLTAAPLSPFATEEEAELVTAFDFMEDPGGFSMEQKQLKKLWYHIRMQSGWVKLYMAPGPGYWGGRLEGLTIADPQAPTQDHWELTVPPFQVNFSNWSHKTLVNVPDGDIAQPPLPDFLTGRGFWLHIRGRNFFFAGVGGVAIWGSDSITLVDTGIEG